MTSGHTTNQITALATTSRQVFPAVARTARAGQGRVRAISRSNGSGAGRDCQRSASHASATTHKNESWVPD